MHLEKDKSQKIFDHFLIWESCFEQNFSNILESQKQNSFQIKGI